MQKKKCWQCAELINVEALVCPNCRGKQPKIIRQPADLPTKKWAPFAAIGGILALVVFAALPNPDSSNQQAPAVSPAPAVDETPAENRNGPAPIAPNIYQPYTRSGFSKTFAKWGEKGVARIQKLREAAAETVAQNPRCDAVEIAEISDTRSTPPDKPVVFVDCRNTERFFLGESDVGGPLSSEKEKGQRFSRAELIQRCTDGVKARLNLPSTFDRNFFSVSDYQGTSGNRVVEFKFTAKNAFGAELPASARCIMTTQGEFEVNITEG